MWLPLVLFALAALGGVFMAGVVLQSRRQPPLSIALIHGAAAAVALILLFYQIVAFDMGGTTVASAVAFLIAAVGGLYLFSRHLSRKPLPASMILIHGAVAVVAFVLLLVSLL